MELKRALEWFTQNHNVVTAVFTVAIAFATVVYAVVATLQWCVMRGQLSEMQATRQLERPWIGPVGRRLALRDKTDARGNQRKEVIGAEWQMENGGHTTAVRTRFKLEVTDGPFQPDFSVRRDKLPKSEDCEKGELSDSFGSAVIVPGVKLAFTAHISPELENMLGEDTVWDELANRKIGVWLVGCVDYSDATRKQWFRTNVLEYYNPVDKGFTVWPIGNDAR